MEMEGLTYLEKWDDNLCQLDASEIYHHYPNPILIHLNKGTGNPIAFCTLLHGNEHSGIEAFKRFFKKHPNITQELVIFIGNTIAAKDNLRQLEDGPDFNRLWSDDVEQKPDFIDIVKKYIRNINPKFSIDIHNNTGKNPLYSCISVLNKDHLALASYFGDATVYFTEPHSAFSVYHSKYFTSMTVEAGTSKEAIGIEKLTQMLEELILNSTNSLVQHKGPRKTYHTIGKVKLPKDSTLSFESQDQNTDFIFDDDLDTLNFTHLLPGFILAKAKELPIVLNDDNENVAADFLRLENDQLVITTEIVPAMLTKNVPVIYSDGLCYFMIEKK